MNMRTQHKPLVSVMVSMYVFMCVCMYVCMYACAYIICSAQLDPSLKQLFFKCVCVCVCRGGAVCLFVYSNVNV